MNRKGIIGILLVITMLLFTGCVIKMQAPTQPIAPVILGEPTLVWSTEYKEPPGKLGDSNVAKPAEGNVVPGHAKAITIWFLKASIPANTPVSVIWLLDEQPVGQTNMVTPGLINKLWAQIHNFGKSMQTGKWIVYIKVGAEEQKIEFTVTVADFLTPV